METWQREQPIYHVRRSSKAQKIVERIIGDVDVIVGRADRASDGTVLVTVDCKSENMANTIQNTLKHFGKAVCDVTREPGESMVFCSVWVGDGKGAVQQTAHGLRRREGGYSVRRRKEQPQEEEEEDDDKPETLRGVSLKLLLLLCALCFTFVVALWRLS